MQEILQIGNRTNPTGRIYVRVAVGGGDARILDSAINKIVDGVRKAVGLVQNIGQGQRLR